MTLAGLGGEERLRDGVRGRVLRQRRGKERGGRRKQMVSIYS